MVAGKLDPEGFVAGRVADHGITADHVQAWWEWLDIVAFHKVVDSLIANHGLVGTVGILPVELAVGQHAPGCRDTERTEPSSSTCRRRPWQRSMILQIGHRGWQG